MERSVPARRRYPSASAIRLTLTFLGALAPAGHLAAGVINLTSQTRFVDVNTQNVPGVVVAPADHRQDAPDFGAFNGSVSLAYLPGVEQGATQNSSMTLTPDGMGALFDAHGALVKSISDNGLNAISHFQVSFTLAAPEPYRLTYNGREGDPRFDNLQRFVPAQFSGPSAPGELTVDVHTGNFFDTVTDSGTLQPGSYQMLADLSTIGTASFDMTVAVGTAAVPLPSAIWAALTLLPILPLAARSMRKTTGSNSRGE